MKFEQDLCKSSWYDFKKLLWKDELNPRVRCAFGNVYIMHMNTWISLLDTILNKLLWFQLYIFFQKWLLYILDVNILMSYSIIHVITKVHWVQSKDSLSYAVDSLQGLLYESCMFSKIKYLWYFEIWFGCAW